MNVQKALRLLALTIAVAAVAPISAASAVVPPVSYYGPATLLAPTPEASNAAATTFSFNTSVGSNTSYVDFFCKLDAGPEVPCLDDLPTCVSFPSGQLCSQSKSYLNLPEGLHTFTVSSFSCPYIESSCNSEADFEDGPPTTRTIVIDRTAPQITASASPSPLTPLLKDHFSLAFFTNEAATTTCTFDGVAWGQCVDSFDADSLKNGHHNLLLSSTDKAGNTAVLSRDFTVDAFKPKKCKKGHSKSAKTKRAKCVKKNAAAKSKWKKKHHLK